MGKVVRLRKAKRFDPMGPEAQTEAHNIPQPSYLAQVPSPVFEN